MQADKKFDETWNRPYTGLALSLILALFKLFAGLLGNSTLLLADAIRSFSECIDEFIKLLDTSIAGKPGDKSHNYGHGKITTLSVGAGAFILLFASFRVISLSSEELLLFLEGKPTQIPEIVALYVAITAFIVRKLIAILTESTEVTKLQVKEASSKAHTPLKSLLITPEKELLMSGFVILSTGCTFLPWEGFDIAHSFAAFLLSFYLLGTSSRLFYRSANELIEASLDEESNLKIREIINKTKNVAGSGELKTRRIGKGIAINAIVDVSSSLSV